MVQNPIRTPIWVLAFAMVAAFYYTKMMDIPVYPAFIVSAAYIVVLYWVIWRGWLFPVYFSELRHVPTVGGFPLWGQLIPIVFEECGLPQRRWHRQHGPIIRYYLPFGCERLSVAGDLHIRHLTVKNPYNFPKPVRAKLWMVRILGEGVLLAEGAEHAYQRKTLNPGFSISAIRTFTPIFWEKALKMSDLQHSEMKDAGESSIKLEILEWLNRCTLDIIGEAGFGYNINSLGDPTLPIRHAYKLVFNFDLASRVLHGIQAFFPSSKHIPAQMNRDMELARSIILNEATKIIDEKLSEAEQTPNAKDVLALIAQENLKLKGKGEAGLSFETMRDQIMTFLAAGHDTTATGAAWTIHLLSIHPEIQDRLRAEIRSYMPFLFHRHWTFDPAEPLTDPDRLPYLDNVCRESLRYIPPIPMTVRESVADDVIEGYKVPARTVIYMLANAINRMAWFWGGDANTFDPDRWDSPDATACPNAFMTFLQGPRGCLGRKFAEVEMKILLCVLLSRWEFTRDCSTPDPEDWKMWRLVLRPRDGITVVARPQYDFIVLPEERDGDCSAQYRDCSEGGRDGSDEDWDRLEEDGDLSESDDGSLEEDDGSSESDDGSWDEDWNEESEEDEDEEMVGVYMYAGVTIVIEQRFGMLNLGDREERLEEVRRLMEESMVEILGQITGALDELEDDPVWQGHGEIEIVVRNESFVLFPGDGVSPLLVGPPE
ncbi:cytochrome P450 [Chaetomium fimeti]|uniref:Cytochrome P450 n=1 Tax=Chaetomium fimeti TaxID=1854472 RepID=A0AAE0LX85_9PEZI|nr:cytochrome P450 [Chaetomium fimeti]